MQIKWYKDIAELKSWMNGFLQPISMQIDSAFVNGFKPATWPPKYPTNSSLHANNNEYIYIMD